MMFLVYGNDGYRARKKLAAVREEFSAKRDVSGLNVRAFRAKEADHEQVAEALFASPFLAERSMVVLEGFLRAPTADQERLKDLLARKPGSTVAVFFENAGADELEKALLYPLLAAQKYTCEYAPFTESQAATFAHDSCVASGVALEPAAARSLVALVGTDSWQLQEESRKLCAYAEAKGLKTISSAAVQALCGRLTEESVFAFLDACVAGRGREAVVMLEQLLASGVSELQIVAMLLKQLRTFIAVRDLVERGERDANAVARKLGIHPFPAGKAMTAVRRFSEATLRTHHRALLKIEEKCKSGSADAAALLDLFAATFA